jgi:hypothetical protein
MSYTLEIRPGNEFRPESGKDKLISLRLAQHENHGTKFHIPEDNIISSELIVDDVSDRQEAFLRLAGLVDTSSNLTVRLALLGLRNMLKGLDWLCWCHHILHTAAKGLDLSSRRRSCS